MKIKVRSEASSRDKDTRAYANAEPVNKQVGEHVDIPKERLGVIKVSNGVTLAFGYQSVRVDVGIELPFDMKRATVKQAFAKAYEMVDEELAERAQEMEGLLKQLAAKHRH